MHPVFEVDVTLDDTRSCPLNVLLISLFTSAKLSGSSYTYGNDDFAQFFHFFIFSDKVFPFKANN
jgi:hypothetical protein